MKHLILALLSVSVTACAAPQPEPYPMPGETPPAADGELVTTSQENVRLPETVKKYEYGRYVKNGKMYSSGTMHVVEQSGAWDLHPGADAAARVPNPAKLQTPTRTEVEEGPLDAAPELPARHVQMSAALEQKLAEQQQITRALSEQLDAQRQLTAELKKTHEAAAIIMGENQRLKQRVADLETAEAERQHKLAEAVAKKEASSWKNKISGWFSPKTPERGADREEK